MLIKQFINRTIKLSKKSIRHSVNEYDCGSSGKLIESLLVPKKYRHTKNVSDMPKLELKTKNEDTSSNNLNLTKYTDFKNAFKRTYNKIKDNLALVYYFKNDNNIHLTRMFIFKKLDFSLYARYLQINTRKNELKHNMTFINLKKCYDSYELIELK